MAQSVRWRLTGWYVALLTVILLIFSAATYLAVRKLVLNNFDDVLAHQAQLIAQTIDIGRMGPAIRGDVLLAGRRDIEHVTRLYGLDGALLVEDNVAAEGAPALTEDVAEALDGHPGFTEVWVRQEPMRIATFPIEHAGHRTGALQVGVSLEDIEDTLRTLRRVLLLMIPTIVLLASGGGWFLANRLLAPIDRITRMAQHISAADLSGRFALRGPDDEIGRLANTFDAMLARLERAFARQRQFTADASHELRTPLTAIIGQIDVALALPRSAERSRETLAAVREQAQRLARLAGDLLFLARSDTQTADVPMESLNLGVLMPAVVAQLGPLAAERQQSVTLAPVPAVLVRGNEDLLMRLLMNLLDNALRYTPAGGHITASCTQEGTNVVICICDTGPGIAPEHIPQLFERFYRADRGRNRAHGGSGLGLAIAQSIAHQHGGRIEVESAVGQGSTFTVTLPTPSPAGAYMRLQTAAMAKMG